MGILSGFTGKSPLIGYKKSALEMTRFFFNLF